MKYFALLFLFTLFAVSGLRADDNPPDDFADVKWGESADAAKAKVLLKPGTKFTAASPDGANLIFEGGTFATFPATRWEFHFATNQFTKGSVNLTPTDTSMASLRRAYESLNKSITKKYRKAGLEEHDGPTHSAMYWTFNTRKGNWQIACDVDARRNGVRLVYSFSPSLKPGSQAAGTPKKDL